MDLKTEIMITYTREQIIDAVKDELIESYGGLSKNDTCYLVLGVLQSAFERITDAVSEKKVAVCCHYGKKRQDPLGGFFCVECGTFVNKAN